MLGLYDRRVISRAGRASGHVPGGRFVADDAVLSPSLDAAATISPDVEN